MAKKVYAVAVGRDCGVFDNWQECREAVQGVNGARWRAFKSKHDAEQWLLLWRAAQEKNGEDWQFIPVQDAG